MKLKIGVITDSLSKDIYSAISIASKIGAEGIQPYATKETLNPDMSTMKRNELKDYIKSNGLTVSALCGDFGGHAFVRREDNAWRIERSKRIMDLALDLECNVVTTHVGVIPESPSDPVWSVMLDACSEMGIYAKSLGAFFAIETGSESAKTLKRFLDDLACSGIGVNYDPANLVMVAGDDPIAGIATLQGHIVHTHAKDGIMKQKSEPKAIYQMFAEGNTDHIDNYFSEMPLGQGGVNFEKYLNTLYASGYEGFLTIEQENGDNPIEEISRSIKYLKEHIAKLTV